MVEGANVNRSVVAEFVGLQIGLQKIMTFMKQKTYWVAVVQVPYVLFPVSFFCDLSLQSSPFAIHRP